MSLPLLQVKDISYTYHTKAGETPALSHISFSVFPGEFIAIVGPSGCGKSTFLDMLCGLLKPAAGELLLNGTPLSMSNTNIGYMLQKDHLFEWRTITAICCWDWKFKGELLRKQKNTLKIF